MESLKPHLTISCLVSAYDIHRGYVSGEISLSDLVFIDSGNYERRILEGQGIQVEWTRGEHEATVDSVVPLTQVAVVNYDEPGTVADQVKSADSFFGVRPKFVSDFLCKPTSTDSDYVAIRDIERNADILSRYDVFGVTEKELGTSPVERCVNLARIRRCFEAAGQDTPIHVFGCLEPVSMVSLALSGGDVFDGLTWARYAFAGDMLVYPGTAQLLGLDWSTDDVTALRATAARNLSSLIELMFRIRSYARTRDFAELGLGKESTAVVKSIMERVYQEKR